MLILVRAARELPGSRTQEQFVSKKCMYRYIHRYKFPLWGPSCKGGAARTVVWDLGGCFIGKNYRLIGTRPLLSLSLGFI